MSGHSHWFQLVPFKSILWTSSEVNCNVFGRWNNNVRLFSARSSTECVYPVSHNGRRPVSQARSRGQRRILSALSGKNKTESFVTVFSLTNFVPQGLLRCNGALWQHIQLLQGQLHLLLRHLPLPFLLWAPEEPAGPGIMQQLQHPRVGWPTSPCHRARG